MTEILLFACAVALAFGNGANDNFKGFATVWGSETLSYRRSLLLATVATLAGGLAAMALASGLAQQFSGKGLVPDMVVNSPVFLGAVAAAAALTVLLASRLGLPVSTTHALIGGLVGAGLAQVGHIDAAKLWSAFLSPMLVSPLIAASLGLVLSRWLRGRVEARDCACVVVAESEAVAADGVLARRTALPSLVVAAEPTCERLDAPVKLSLATGRDHLHVLSAMSVCFARGLNDAPKMAALLLAAHAVDRAQAVTLIAVTMAVGGLVFARRVARTMSQRITRMDHGQGLAANLVTTVLVLFASKLGLPVSTTHVSVGAIAGVGAGGASLNRRELRHILLSWLATLPLAAGVAYAVARLL